MQTVLNPFRVLDFGRYIAGPYCAHLLAQLGADVIRIERPGGGEDRFIMPITPAGEGAMFMQVNAGKRGLTLDIGSAEGGEVIRKLVSSADIVVANMPDLFLEKLGLDYATLTSIKPDIILVKNSTFGSEGAWANKPGFDGIGQSMSGAAWFSGMPGRPSKTTVTYVDYASALAATVATLAAIMHRQQTGKGQIVETSLLATALTLNSAVLTEQAVIEPNRQPTGNRAQVAGPADIFDTADGHIIVQVVGPYIFKRLSRMFEKPEWLEDPRFKDDLARGDHREILCRIVAEWAADLSTEEALKRLEANRVPAGPILSPQQALDHPAVRTLNQLVPTQVEGAEKPVPLARPPYRLSSQNDKPVVPPGVGEHTDLILSELGYSREEIERLRERNLV